MVLGCRARLARDTGLPVADGSGRYDASHRQVAVNATSANFPHASPGLLEQAITASGGGAHPTRSVVIIAATHRPELRKR